MSSRGKKKTTMAKLSRESRLRERRVEKNARKNARKEAAANGTPMLGLEPEDGLDSSDLESADLEPGQDEFAHVAPSAPAADAPGASD